MSLCPKHGGSSFGIFDICPRCTEDEEQERRHREVLEQHRESEAAAERRHKEALDADDHAQDEDRRRRAEEWERAQELEGLEQERRAIEAETRERHAKEHEARLREHAESVKDTIGRQDELRAQRMAQEADKLLQAHMADEAVPLLERAVKLAPTSLSTRKLLVAALNHIGEHDRAREQIKRLVALAIGASASAFLRSDVLPLAYDAGGLELATEVASSASLTYPSWDSFVSACGLRSAIGLPSVGSTSDTIVERAFQIAPADNKVFASFIKLLVTKRDLRAARDQLLARARLGKLSVAELLTIGREAPCLPMALEVASELCTTLEHWRTVLSIVPHDALPEPLRRRILSAAADRVDSKSLDRAAQALARWKDSVPTISANVFFRVVEDARTLDTMPFAETIATAVVLPHVVNVVLELDAPFRKLQSGLSETRRLVEWARAEDIRIRAEIETLTHKLSGSSQRVIKARQKVSVLRLARAFVPLVMGVTALLLTPGLWRILVGCLAATASFVVVRTFLRPTKDEETLLSTTALLEERQVAHAPVAVQLGVVQASDARSQRQFDDFVVKFDRTCGARLGADPCKTLAEGSILLGQISSRPQIWPMPNTLEAQRSKRLPPLGRKVCRRCSSVSFDVVDSCPSCATPDWWSE